MNKLRTTNRDRERTINAFLHVLNNAAKVSNPKEAQEALKARVTVALFAGCYMADTTGQWHAPIGCYGRHRSAFDFGKDLFRLEEISITGFSFFGLLLGNDGVLSLKFTIFGELYHWEWRFNLWDLILKPFFMVRSNYNLILTQA